MNKKREELPISFEETRDELLASLERAHELISEAKEVIRPKEEAQPPRRTRLGRQPASRRSDDDHGIVARLRGSGDGPLDTCRDNIVGGTMAGGRGNRLPDRGGLLSPVYSPSP
jgi:hypothetical protein